MSWISSNYGRIWLEKITALKQKNPEHSYFIKTLVGTFYRFTSLINSARCWENTSITVNHESKAIFVLTYPVCDIVIKMITGSIYCQLANRCSSRQSVLEKISIIFKTTTLLNAFFSFFDLLTMNLLYKEIIYARFLHYSWVFWITSSWHQTKFNPWFRVCHDLNTVEVRAIKI